MGEIIDFKSEIEHDSQSFKDDEMCLATVYKDKVISQAKQLLEQYNLEFSGRA